MSRRLGFFGKKDAIGLTLMLACGFAVSFAVWAASETGPFFTKEHVARALVTAVCVSPLVYFRIVKN